MVGSGSSTLDKITESGKKNPLSIFSCGFLPSVNHGRLVSYLQITADVAREMSYTKLDGLGLVSIWVRLCGDESHPTTSL